MGARTRALAVEALGYDKGTPSPVSLDDRAFREFIAWLEDTKIRALPLGARAGLRDLDAPSPAWRAAFSALATAVGCDLGPTDSHAARVFDLLLEQAVALEYRDHAADLNAVVKDLKAAASGGAAGGGIPPAAKRQRVAPPQPEGRRLMDG